jgi:hypothetical protein
MLSKDVRRLIMSSKRTSSREHTIPDLGRGKMLMKEYDVLVDLIKLQHQRRMDLDRTFLTVNALIAGACAVILQFLFNYPKNPMTYGAPLPVYLLALLGIIISILWICVSERLSIDTDLRWLQVRYIERRLGRKFGNFSAGKRFFSCGTLTTPDKKDLLSWPNGLWGLLARFRVVWAARCLPMVFVLFYAFYVVFMLIMGKSESVHVVQPQIMPWF